MAVRGLSNQWQTYDALISRFAASDPLDMCEKYPMIRNLLVTLNQRSESTIYIGTSLSVMNFSVRDAVSMEDRTQPFAYVTVDPMERGSDIYIYRTATRKLLGIRPTTQWISHQSKDVDDVVDRLIASSAYFEIPPYRTIQIDPFEAMYPGIEARERERMSARKLALQRESCIQSTNGVNKFPKAE